MAARKSHNQTNMYIIETDPSNENPSDPSNNDLNQLCEQNNDDQEF